MHFRHNYSYMVVLFSDYILTDNTIRIVQDC